jgi:acetyl esterase/lipase
LRRTALILPLLLALAMVATTSVAHAKPRSLAVDREIDYDLGSPPLPPSTPEMNRLDLYRPRGTRDSPRPLIVWIHGGGWRKGDKRVGIARKAKLFTRMGFVLASVNYRLSAAPFDPERPDPHRVRFPAHPHDVAEAVAWLHSHARKHGIDRRQIVLIGHSAGAHLAALVGTDRRYLRAYGVPSRHLAGFVTLDPPAFDVAAAADPELSRRPEEGREMLWNAFGTPAENELWGSWREGSPIEFAGPNDPPALMVTQADNRQRLTDHRAMAEALQRNPARVVFPVPLDHRAIGRALGIPRDVYGETAAVEAFLRRTVR